MNGPGFTLIEVLIYLALLSLIFFGLFVSAFSIIENIGRGDIKIMAQREGDFLISKIGWAVGLSDVIEIVDSVTLKASGPQILIFKENNGYLEMNGEALNNSLTQVEDLQFDKAGNVIGVNFILRAITANGKTYSQNFEGKYYFRK